MSDTNQLQDQWDYWYPRVYGYFYKRVNDKTEVEDLTANTLSTVFMAQNVQNIQAYMWKVAHNYLVKFINTKSTTPMMVALDENIDGWQPSEQELKYAQRYEAKYEDESEDRVPTHYEQKLNQLKQCILNKLSDPLDLQLIELSIYEEKNSTEIGKLLELKADTVRQKLSRLLKKLRSHCLELWPN